MATFKAMAIVINIQPSALAYMMNTASTISIVVLENLKANTIKNDVNLRKSILWLEKMRRTHASTWALSLLMSLLLDGYVSFSFPKRDHRNQNGILCFVLPSERTRAEFYQEPGTGVNLSLFSED